MFVSEKLIRFLGFLFLAFVWALMTYLSWLKWPDLIVDFGREIYVPWQLSNGSDLYKDIAYFNGPLSPYLNSVLLRLFGEALITIEIFNIMLVAGLTYLIYRLFVAEGERISAVAVSAVFLLIFAFGKYFPMGSYNFIAPYSHEVVHGTFLSFLAIYALKVYLSKKKTMWVALSGLCAGLVILTKPEIAVSAVAALMAGLFCIIWIEKRPAALVKAFIAGLILPILAFIVYLSAYMGLFEAVKGVFSPWIILATTDISSSRFYKTLAGFDNTADNLKVVFFYTLAWLAVLIIPLAATYLTRKNASAKKYGWAVSLIVTAGVFAYFFDGIKWLLVLRPLPLFAAGMTVLFAVMFFRAPDKGKALALVPLFSFSVFSLFMLLKIILNVQVNGYGFVLAMPAALLAAYVLLSFLPSALKKAWGHAAVLRSSALAIIIVMSAWHLKTTKAFYDRMTYDVGVGGDTIRTFDPALIGVGVGMNVLLENIERIMGPDDSFVMMPEGALVNYLSRRANPSGFINFVPADVAMFGEERMVAALEKSPPDYIILISRDTSEYGVHYLGQDYGFRIFSFVANRYEKVLRIGNEGFLTRSTGFSQPLGMVVFKRVS